MTHTDIRSTVAAVVLLSCTLAVPAAQAGDMLKAGDSFPAWTLADHAGASVSSAELAGKKYVLWYFPRAMTSGCTTEGRGFRDLADQYQKQGVTVFGVSFDDPDANARFVKEEGFPFRLLSDRDKSLAIAVGAADSTWRPLARRISYLVGADGKVLHAYGDVSPATHAAEILRDLAAPDKP